MTEQYQRNNINNPRGSRNVDGGSILTLDDDLIVVDSSLTPVAVELPNAVQIPGNTVYIKAPQAGTNSVTVTGLDGQTIDGLASLVLSADEASALFKSDGANWQLFLGGSPETQQNGATVVESTRVYNFTGAGVAVTGAGNTATVDIPGGIVASSSFAFSDTGVTLVTPALGSIINGLYSVEANISQAAGLSSSYIITVAVSPTGVGASVLDVQSDAPITTVSIDATISAGNVFLRLTGTGVGTASTINYQITHVIVRALP